MKPLFFVAALALAPALACASDWNVRVSVEGDFAEVRDAVQMAIEGQGLNINHTNQIAGMLERTGKDLGATRKVYAHAEQFEFCSAKLSRAMMEADPHAIVMCPYIVSVYQLPDSPEVHIAFRKPPTTGQPALDGALGEVEALLRAIAADAR